MEGIVLRKVTTQVFLQALIQSGQRLQNADGNGLFERVWPLPPAVTKCSRYGKNTIGPAAKENDASYIQHTPNTPSLDNAPRFPNAGRG